MTRFIQDEETYLTSAIAQTNEEYRALAVRLAETKMQIDMNRKYHDLLEERLADIQSEMPRAER